MARKSKVARKRPNRPTPTVRRPAASAAPEIADVEMPLAEASTGGAITEAPTPDRVAPRPGPSGGPARGPAARGVSRLEPSAVAARRRERAPRPGSLSAGFDPLDPADPAIPYDRVPYVPADLRRVAIIAGAMILLIVLADIIVSTAVK